MNKPITLCDRCEEYARCCLDYDGRNCRRNRTVEPTNADRLRAMSDEELAEFFEDTTFCDSCSIFKNECGTEKYSCKQRWLDWLRQEAQDATD